MKKIITVVALMICCVTVFSENALLTLNGRANTYVESDRATPVSSRQPRTVADQQSVITLLLEYNSELRVGVGFISGFSYGSKVVTDYSTTTNVFEDNILRSSYDQWVKPLIKTAGIITAGASQIIPELNSDQKAWITAIGLVVSSLPDILQLFFDTDKEQVDKIEGYIAQANESMANVEIARNAYDNLNLILASIDEIVARSKELGIETNKVDTKLKELRTRYNSSVFEETDEDKAEISALASAIISSIEDYLEVAIQFNALVVNFGSSYDFLIHTYYDKIDVSKFEEAKNSIVDVRYQYENIWKPDFFDQASIAQERIFELAQLAQGK